MIKFPISLDFLRSRVVEKIKLKVSVAHEWKSTYAVRGLDDFFVSGERRDGCERMHSDIVLR